MTLFFWVVFQKTWQKIQMDPICLSRAFKGINRRRKGPWIASTLDLSVHIGWKSFKYSRVPISLGLPFKEMLNFVAWEVLQAPRFRVFEEWAPQKCLMDLELKVGVLYPNKFG